VVCQNVALVRKKNKIFLFPQVSNRIQRKNLDFIVLGKIFERRTNAELGLFFDYKQMQALHFADFARFYFNGNDFFIALYQR